MMKSARRTLGNLKHKTDQERRRKKAEQTALTDPTARPFLGLNEYSLALDPIQFTSARPSVNAIFLSAKAGSMFAGSRSALIAAASMAALCGRPLRVISLDPLRANDVDAITTIVGKQAPSVEVSVVDALHDVVEACSADTWLATHFTTAHCLDNLCRRGVLDPERIVYLIQDYEPSFLPAGTDYFLARSTYHAGFIPLVNSLPLANHLQRAEAITVNPGAVFAPALDVTQLEKSASQPCNAAPTVFFYARPNKPRNMFNLGVSSLMVAADLLEDHDEKTQFVGVGAEFASVQLSPRHTLVSEGQLGWDAYFVRLAQGRVLLSLQATPHPSHPPLDMVAMGRQAVTNEVLGGTRNELHPRLTATEADPESLGVAVAQAVTSGDVVRAFDSEFVASLGGDFEACVAHALEQVG
ncbi:hypothetical protein [Dermacoccus barathri]|uniref:Uncharacterized protein n=1 Tax=Dermacoccus barathri TaxID=322601 RepID=A0ABN2B6V1_9MICO